MNSDLGPILAADPTVAAISSLLDTKQASIDALTQQVQSLTGGDATLQAQIADLTKQVSDLQAQHSADVQTVQNLTAQDATDEATIKTLNDQAATQAAALSALQAQVAALQAQLSATQTGASFALLDLLSGRRSTTVLAELQKLPANTTSNKEVLGVWIDSGGHTAQSNPATNTTPHGTFTWTPGTDTTPARIVFTPAAGWDNIFEYEHFNLPPSLPTEVVDIRSYSMTAADRAVANAVEFQQEFIWGGKVYNMAWQLLLSGKRWRYFDMNGHAWKDAPGVPFTDLGTTPLNIMTEFILDEVAGTTTHVAINLNGTRYPVNITQSATPKPGANNKYTISINQLDSDSKGDPFGLNIHNCEARYIV